MVMKKAYKLRKAGTGKSVQVMIPALWAQSHNLKAGDFVMVEIETGHLVIRPMVKGDKNATDN
jgi:antitoxin component of MazEF toxin-antitoxin module